MSYHPAGGTTYTLQSSISSTQTTITLTSFTVPTSGDLMTMALMGTDICYATIAPRTSQSEFISFTGITQNADNTATLTGVTRGLNKLYPYTENTTFKLPHAGATQFILSDAPQVFNKFSIIGNDETITGQKTLPAGGSASATLIGATYSAPTQDREVVSKKYVDDTAIAGSPKATNTVFGIAKLSTAASSSTTPIVVGTNDVRVPTADPTTLFAPLSIATFIAPTGTITAFAGASAPTNWLLCDGTAVSRTTYATLFALISTTYGVGDGSTTFNLPNLKGSVPVGRDAGQTEFDVLGETGGEKTHTLTTPEIPAHTHGVAYSLGGGANPSIGGSGTGSTTIQTGSTGGGGAHNNLQPYLVINYIIKT